MSKPSVDIVTVSRFGVPQYYYWALSTKDREFAGKEQKTEEDAWDDLAEWIQSLITSLDKANSVVNDTQVQ